ncbi:MAG: AAA family ATPase [Flavobacteriaceae bacterium]
MGFFGSDENKWELIYFKVYNKKDSLQYGRRRNRVVYDESELTHLFFEVSLHNRMYKKENWKDTLTFRVENLNTNKLVIEFEEEFEINKNKSEHELSHGYGNKNGGFWKKGYYKVTASFGNVEIGFTHFYVFDKGVPTIGSNPYFNIYGFKLHAKPSKETKEQRDKRTYYSTFNEEDLTYLGVEISLEPNNKKGLYPTQIMLYINNVDGVQKAIFDTEPYTMEASKGSQKFSTNFGVEDGSFWVKGTYQIFVHFMDVLVGVTEFKVSNNNLHFNGENMLVEMSPSGASATRKAVKIISNISFEEAKQELDELIGLEKVKKEVDELATFLQFVKIRAEKGIEDKAVNSNYLIFTGNPGTGKTTVAKMLGKIYKSLGVLSSGHLVEVGRAELIAEFIGQTAPKVKKVIEQARGGVLFVDEAYALARKGESEKDYGKEAIEVLMKEMSDGEGDLVIIFAGYPTEMNDFEDSNPGIKSRISQRIHFDDYTPKELFDISLYAANKKNVSVSKDAQKLLQEKLYEVYRTRDNDFGNARYVFSVIQEAKTELAMRTMKNKKFKELSKEELSLITLEDISEQFETENSTVIDIPIDERLLEESLAELNQLIGLTFVKQEIFEVIKLVKYYRKIRKDFRKDFSLHKVFTGNPGTGKTTMARILVKIYKALGILERGHLVEVDRSELVAGYTGQTATKTEAIINSAMGGMLFIDEAYSLVTHGDSFGEEAIETLLKRMEDDRGKFTVVAAGYTNQMKQFLDSNPGLNSRFDRIWNFQDYTVQELLGIAELMFLKEDLQMNEEAEAIFIEKLAEMKNTEGTNFGNARSVRRIVDEVKKNQLLRMAEKESETISQKEIETVKAIDFENLSQSKIKGISRPTLGFK